MNNPSQISSIIKTQIENYKSKTEMRETGKVILVGDGIARVFGLTNCMANELLAFEDGSFGMWEETGSWMNEAIKLGAEKNYGYGQSLADYVDNNPEKFPYRDDCVFYRAYKMGIPVTYHVTMGTDIIHQHPSVDFEALGKTSGIDFKYFCHSISMLGDNGVHLNIGSAVTGAEVFLKALSIARNQGHALKYITTANFDIIPLGDYKTDVGKDTFEYYYRPRKNIINRPVSLGGTGLYICGNHEQTIPSLYARLKG